MSFIHVISSSYIRLAGRAKCTIKERNGQILLVGKYLGKLPLGKGGTRWRIWLRHCTTSRKVAGSISDGVIGIFH
jgi:hypothetical protein